MKQIINLTQHKLTDEQKIGFDVVSENLEISHLLNFVGVPTQREIINRALSLGQIAKSVKNQQVTQCYVLLGGAPYLMGDLQNFIRAFRMIPVYSFSERVSSENLINGVVQKTSIFKHVDFIKM